jgi:Xaa-Pro aminopeptidase
MSDESWTQNPALAGIDPAKLQLLLSLAGQAKGKNQNELLTFLMAASTKNQAQQLSFEPSEIDAIIEVLKVGKSPQELQKIERLCTLMKQLQKRS